MDKLKEEKEEGEEKEEVVWLIGLMEEREGH